MLTAYFHQGACDERRGAPFGHDGGGGADGATRRQGREEVRGLLGRQEVRSQQMGGKFKFGTVMSDCRVAYPRLLHGDHSSCYTDLFDSDLRCYQHFTESFHVSLAVA